MECPRCRHVSSERVAKFCSQCGLRLPPAAPTADAENNSLMCSAAEGELELGEPLKEDGDLHSIQDSGNWQENSEEPSSDASWTLVQKSKRKRRKKKNQNQSNPSELSSLSPSLSDCSSLYLLSSPGSLDTAVPHNQTQKGDLASQPGQPLDSGMLLVEEGGPLDSVVHAEGGDSPVQGQSAGATGTALGSMAQEPPRGPDPKAPMHSEDQSPTGEQSSPTSSACEGHPVAANVTQQSESKGDNLEPKKKEQKERQQAGSPASGGTDDTAEPANKANRATKDMKDKTQPAKQPLESPTTPKESCQKAEAKGKSAVAGGKTSKNGNVKLEDRKKAEESNRTQPAAVKNEKQQRNQSVVAQEVTASILGPGEGLTVYFHAILSKDFAFDPKCHQVFVRGSKGLGKQEWKDACEMHYAKDLQETGCLIEGSMVIPKQSINCPIPYKYVIVKAQDSVEYEFIYKKQKKGEHVNRCLHIPSQLVAEGEWHQYDDIICMKPGTWVHHLQKAKDFFTDGRRKDLVAGKHMAAVVMLDRIFSILQTWNIINLRNFFAQFLQFYSVVREPVVYEGEREIWSDLQLTEKEVKGHLWEYLKKQMAPFLDVKSGDALPEDFPVKSRLQMGLIVLFVVNRIQISLSKSDLASLSNLLIPSAASPDALHSNLGHFRSTSERWREYLVNLCQFCMEEGIHQWLGTLPVLHYCMQLTPAKNEPVNQQEDMWAALEGILFSKFRESTTNLNQLLQFMNKNKHLLYVDEYLFRSWFSLLPLKGLVEYMDKAAEFLNHAPAHVLDCFLGIYYRMAELQISPQSVADVEKVFKKLLQLVDTYHGVILENTLVQCYLPLCLKLHEAVCHSTREWKFCEIPSLSAELISKIINLQPLQDTAGPGAEASRSVFQGALTATRNWLKKVFRKSMLCSEVSFALFSYPEEIQVWRRLVGINFPVAHNWKKSLLGDMEGRLKQAEPRLQIAAFCSTQWDATGLDDSVATSFQNCVFEAVNSTCQSQTSILEGLSCQDCQKLGILLSAVVTKSWPQSNGQAVDDPDEILKYLLTWRDVEQLFKLYGTNEKILASITEEGQKLMAIADSVFTKVAGDLQDGTILVGQLELIRKHRTQFLSIWELKKKCPSGQENQCNMKEVLDWRWKELRILKREARWVDSLLKLCGKTRHLVPVDFGEMEAKHSEDLNSKRLNEAVTVTLPTSPISKHMTHYNLSSQVQEMAEKIDLLKDSHIFQVLWEEMAQSLSNPEEELERQNLQLTEVYEYLYLPCYARFTELYHNLKSGKVTFAKINDIFKDFVDKYGDLDSDLQLMCLVNPGARKDWIPERIQQIREYHSLNQAISSARVIQQVKENFELTGDFSVLHTLLNFNDDFENFCHETLDQISPQLIQAKKKLQNISEPRRRCLEELSLQTELVSWLHEALEGINELKVFVDLASISAGENDIDVDRVACFHDAVQGYACLLYDLDRTAGFEVFMSHLTELWKALDNDENLPNKLRDSARNLEWLKTVKESHGSVELSSLTLAKAINSKGIYVIKAPTGGQKISPDVVLSLILPESHGGLEEVRNYSLEELKELLNKLMLMSGKKDHNNEEVERFSEVFSGMQRLLQAFLNLYTAGNMLFRAWTAEVYCCPRQGKSLHVDFGLELVTQLSEKGDVTTCLEALCRKMEHFLDRWKRFVMEKRAEHFYLNFYTAEQLVYLSTELRKSYPSKAALTMLSFIKSNCTTGDVLKATGRCNSEPSMYHVSTVMTELSLQLNSEVSLETKLQFIMEQSLECPSAFLPGCLDLDALGLCLAQLARMVSITVERPLPHGLQVGQPNLILCGHSEVLLAALAIYMQAPDEPLPTFDEVLLCTPETTFEEVALLLRRCLTPGAQGHKIYSLLFADQLNYEVAYQVEALFHSLCTQCHREDYQLVVVCDAAREHCCLPSAFSQHKALLTPQESLSDIQAYLEHHYKVPKLTLSAGSVFRDRMCVGIVTSERAGVGKSLYVKRLHGKLEEKFGGNRVPLKVIRLTDPRVDENQVLGSLLPFLDERYQQKPMIFHLDVTASVQTGIWVFLFKLLILQYLMDINGKMWLRNPRHLYIVEILERKSELPNTSSKLSARALQFNFLDIFPKVTCRPPKEVIDMELTPKRRHRQPRMDEREFRSETFQRPYQYLRRFHHKQNLDTFQYQEGSVEGTPEECIQHLLIYCGVVNPSWSELQNFARFLNCQLRDCEASVFCNAEFVGDTLRGFKNFVVTFMVFMARDFATPTLHTSDQSPGNFTITLDGIEEEDLAPFSLRKRWESEPHPYIFFNGDRVTMTFIGFYLQPNNNGSIDAINHLSGEVIKRNVMTLELYRGLLLQRVPFNIDFDNLPRHEKLAKLCQAIGIQWAIDPDETYELTTDNMLKILAIEMRFRCGIPVIIMGETGCGKTKLIKFLSDLRRAGANTDTMKLVKVHGGTTPTMIYRSVNEAENIAFINKHQHQVDTILFFDEANTTEAISCIKEVLCDGTVDGQPLENNSGLHIIAACNPYRKHSQEMICRLESAGLGYRVSAEETAEKLGSIPLRQLVYRVHALPPSLIPLVWDFGQLNDTAERLYIQQIVQRLVDSVMIDDSEIHMITEVLSASQGFMRQRENECSFVSLRDVERCVRVFQWFHKHSDMLLANLNTFLCKSNASKNNFKRDPVLWSLVLAIGVCYHASLEKKEPYRRAICRFLPEPYNDSKVVLDEITQVQDLFLSGVPLRKTIAKNLALKENVFMMIICIELKIPLFLVGKPGSSKSLAKTIVADAMQGQAAHSNLFHALKQVHLVSFQCSPHSTPQGIIGTFRQCARFQQGKDLQQYVSVVVLDEVGLAEDSPKMPLKTLHPLLEDGCIEDDPAPHKKVGFIGISNWALDPAKMNRGIFVSRGSPNEKELIDSAKGICSSDNLLLDKIQGYFGPFARAYETVCKEQDKEFFGLRDYYSLIKMVFATAKASNKKPSPQNIAQAVLRNFSGKDDIQALDIFTASLPEARWTEEVSTIELIKQNIYGGLQRATGTEGDDTESRYLLVLTKNYVALQILQQTFFGEDQQPEIIFGSSFPQDQEYTQICRNINRVKVCMETGRMVVLLNLQNLYESLYDALNQYYVYLGGQKYVDLGLGTHRVKCRVHPAFRLIVIEEKDVVYRQFPVPLINRLEKHFLDIHTMLEPWQKKIVCQLTLWAQEFADVKADQFLAGHKYSPADVFIGYHSDACASVVLQATERQGPRPEMEELDHKVMEEAKLILLDCATPDAMVRLSTSKLGSFAAGTLSEVYYYQQQHNSFADFLQVHLRTRGLEYHAIFTEITTFSRLLTSHDCEILAAEVEGLAPKPTILSLQQFDTEYSFLKSVRNCLASKASCKILIIQTDFDDGTYSAQLIASAKYSALNEVNKTQERNSRVFVYFITKVSRMGSGASYVGFHGGLWRSVHIDDLRRSTIMASDVTKLQSVTISQLFKPRDKPEREGSGEEEMETEPSRSGEAAETEMEVQVLDTTKLLQSCVQSAVGMLRDQNEGCTRNMRRVVILLSLLNEDNACNASFLRVSKKHLHVLLKKQEENQPCSLKEWVSREASDLEALQEAGTFRHTLWKRVQGAITPLLASMIALLDRDTNLELLAQSDLPTWTRDLWMFIFSDDKLLDIPLVHNMRSRSDMPSILVQNYMAGNASNVVPFSWRIKDYLEELCVQAQYITDAKGLPQKFVDIFQQTPLGQFFTQLPEEQQLELLHSYSKDFLLLTMKVSSLEELKFLQMALWSCLRELQMVPGTPEGRLSLPWVHLAYQYFRTRLQNFSRILTIHPAVLRSLSEDPPKHNLAGCEMTLDAFAAMACVEKLTEDTLKPTPQAWLQLVKNLSTPLELICSDGYLQGSGDMTRVLIREVRNQWNRIFSVSLFVEHVLLGIKSQVPSLSQLVTKYVFQLDKCLQENSDIKTHRPFVAVMTTLCECKEQASNTFSRFGIHPCPICLGDTQDPVCLPCDHVYCLACLRTWLAPGQMLCPYCLTALPDSFSLTISQEHREAVRKHAHFRRMCNSFFVDLVSTMCFKDNTPPQKSVIDSLLSLLFIQKEILRDTLQRRREHTKSLSPFDDVVDKTPVIRSVVLKLLLKYSFQDVKNYIQDYLSLLESKTFILEDKTELYMLFINCLEDSMHEKTSSCSRNNELSYLREEANFLQLCSRTRHGQESATVASIEYLQELARIRLCLDRASDFLTELPEHPELAEERQRYLQKVQQFCVRSGNDWYRVYLVRKLSNQRGMDFVQSFSRQDHPCHWVFPKEVITEQKEHLSQMDGYLVYGEEYKAVRDAVGHAMLQCKTPGIGTALMACSSPRPQQAVYLLLALYREVAALFHFHSTALHPKPEQCEALNKFIEESKLLSPETQCFATPLVDNTLPLLHMGPGAGSLEGTVAEMAIHTAAVLLCGQNSVLKPLRNLAFSPATMQNAYLPTMPEDLLAQARNWRGLELLRWYTCPNGHPCTVGECGMPMQQARCVDCHALIGGVNHRPEAGFHVIQPNGDRTQSGHVLGNPQPRGVAVAPDRELSPVVFILLRLLTHLALLLGAAQKPKVLGNIIKPPVADPKAFLQQHIQRDLEQLTKMLGKNADETCLVVHLVLRRLFRVQHPISGQKTFNFDEQLSTKDQRNNWEKYMEVLLLPELESLDKTILTVNTLISQDERISSSPVAKIIYSDPATFLPHLPKKSVVHCSKIWNCRKKITVEYLQHIVEQKNGKETLPVLWHFLQREAELRLVKFLPEILALQKSLVNQFQNVPEIESGTIRKFIKSHSSDRLKKLFEDRITIFLSTWNALRRSLGTNGEIKLPEEYCSSDLDLDSDFEVILPRRRGLGLCSTALVSYLINVHNKVVYMVEKFSKENNSYSVDASEITDLHVISYDVERDLTPLILSNCQYQVVQGGETSQEFDLEKIQRQIKGRLLQGKPRLTIKGIPTLVHRHDRNYEGLFMDIKKKMIQSALPSAVMGTIGGQLQSYSDACEALSVIEVTLGFLSTAGGDPNMHLNVYIQESLRMGDQTTSVLKVLSRCQLKHTIALWQLLSAHKSEQLLRLKKEPFQEISPRYKEALSPEHAKLLSTFLNRSSLDTFLLELHEMMVLKLKNTQAEDSFNHNWSLRDTLVSYMETKDSEVPPDLESQFPEEILLSSCVSVWKAAAIRKRDRQAK
ncbi:PREDICTED: E3 ubiquitin-protein ligase RNF213 isoform X2 [Chinchilla lanigera]|uniref:E3 ubiquitin-protein ligase RNF213 isoform X2 n=1 Tax=Chinchilla lanigera TaxID=34839 RepID=UPI00038EE99F|nr:PREDICTED: E3 ubiquitin-protein ligase RNF213 isoform X2 [Chinchilla lanigera]